MGKECGAWVSRRLWGGGNTSPLKTTAWEATLTGAQFDFGFQCGHALLAYFEPHYESEASCTVYIMKISFHANASKTNFHVKSFAPSTL